MGKSILRFHESFLLNNTAQVEGGGCSFSRSSNVVFVRTAMEHNTAFRGAGLSCDHCDVLGFDLYSKAAAPPNCAETLPDELDNLWKFGMRDWNRSA